MFSLDKDDKGHTTANNVSMKSKHTKTWPGDVVAHSA